MTLLLRALVTCFKDESWPVRDAACTACGRCVAACPEETRLVLPELYPLWEAHLWDNIPTVRANAAAALGACCVAYTEDAPARCWDIYRRLVTEVDRQPADSQRFSSLGASSTFGVAEASRKRANEIDVHENQQMFSCGSLAPKLQRGGGCMDHGFKRDQEPWEATDGALHLLRALCEASCSGSDLDLVVTELPRVAQLGIVATFIHAPLLWETAFGTVASVARKVPSGRLKPCLPDVLPCLFKGLQCDHPLAAHAAGGAVAAIRDTIGPNILNGRLDEAEREVVRRSPYVPAGRGVMVGRGEGGIGSQGGTSFTGTLPAIRS